MLLCLDCFHSGLFQSSSVLWPVSSSFLVISVQYSSVRMYHSLFIHFPIDGNCGVPRFFAIRNKAAKTSFNICSHFYWVNIFEKNCLVIAAKIFSKMVVPFYTHASNVKDSTCLIFLPTTNVTRLLWKCFHTHLSDS